MKQFTYSCFYLLLGLAFLSSCAGTKQLAAHKEVIDRIAYDNQMPTKEKVDVLGKTTVILIDESLSKTTVIGTYKHLNKFTNQNSKSLDKVFGEIEQWHGDMNGPQRVAFGAGLATKSYTRQLITKTPKLKKKLGSKYKQLVFIAKVLNFFNPLKSKKKNKTKK